MITVGPPSMNVLIAGRYPWTDTWCEISSDGSEASRSFFIKNRNNHLVIKGIFEHITFFLPNSFIGLIREYDIGM
jgi:hypothetical protein